MANALAGLGYAAFLGVGIVQIVATKDGFAQWIGLSEVAAWIGAFVVGWIPLVGTAVGVMGATGVWGWSWPSALALFLFPFAIAGIRMASAAMAERQADRAMFQQARRDVHEANEPALPKPQAETPKPVAAHIREASEGTFMAEVVDASFDQPVIVDFWAPWCGPCRQLGPILESAVTATDGAVRLVKVNIDENQKLAQEMSIQSIPAVYAFLDGKPEDGFIGALPPSQVREFVGKVAALAHPHRSPVEEGVGMARQALADGDVATARMLFQQVLEEDRENVPALAGRAMIHVQTGELSEARALIARIPLARWSDPDVAATRQALTEATRKAT